MSADLSLPWYASLSEKARGELLRLGTVQRFAPGQMLIKKDTAETHLFLLEEGEVMVLLGQGRTVRLGKGDLVGESAFLDSRLRSSTVVARTATLARRIDRLELAIAFADDPVQLRSVIDTIAALRVTRMEPAPRERETPESFVARLARDAVGHRAVRHPYLQALADGTYPDPRWVLEDFAVHYYGYSAHYPRYLTTVISRLENPAHRRSLLESLTDESGAYEAGELDALAALGIDPEWVEGVPHSLLLQRFSTAIGVSHEGRTEADQVTCWREAFLSVLSAGSPAEAVGALGLGTDNILRAVYAPFVHAIERLGELHPRETVFFPVQTAMDDPHQAALLSVCGDFAHSEEGRSGLRRGMIKALTLRTAFWDWLHERALDPARADAVL